MDIDKLEGRDLDAAVAEKVMGWIWITSELNKEQKILIPTDESILIPGSSWWWGRDVKELVPCYSTDISAAWLVVEKATSFRINRVEYFPSVWWECEYNGVEAQAKTAPLAICRAAFKAVEEK